MRIFSHTILPGFLLAGLLLSGCSTFQRISTKLPAVTRLSLSPSKSLTAATVNPAVAFMDPLPIKQEEKNIGQPLRVLADSSYSITIEKVEKRLAEDLESPSAVNKAAFLKADEVSTLQLKFSVLLEQDLLLLPDSKLLAAIDPWMGVRYRSGGTTTQGIDCSAFTASVLSTYAGVQLPRTCREQFQQYPKVDKEEIQVGDLLFFRTRGRSVSHVGIYLGNNKFVHASSSNGVIVSSRSEPYFSTRFVGARRVPSLSPSESAF
ncbi:MAG: C40 family peptidase [Bacteroidetes bacterium]|nr:C40 family peptidase [Bacteroidota bacterium]